MLWHVFENCSQVLLVCLMKDFQTIARFLWWDEIWNEDQVWPPKVCKQKRSSFYSIIHTRWSCLLSFHLEFPTKMHVHTLALDFRNLQSKGTRQSRAAFPLPAPLAAANKGPPGRVLPLQG